MPKSEKQEKSQPDGVISGRLNILGLEIDLGELLASPETLQGRLEELRETLESVSGKEVLSHTEWKGGGMGISGQFRTSGILGDKEYHVGTMGKTARRSTPKRTAEPPDVTEPPMDVFYDENQVTIVADVPGTSLEDLELRVEKGVFFLATKGTALRSYRKELPLDVKVAPESLKATCNNGALEIRLQRLNEKGG